MGVTHILPKIADTPMDDDGVRRPLYYQRALPSCQMISAAGLTPIGWIFMHLFHPEAEAEFIRQTPTEFQPRPECLAHIRRLL